VGPSRLVAELNRESDVMNSRAQRILLDLGGRDPCEVIGLLLAGLALYGDDAYYEAIPGLPGFRGEHNSNSFYAGLSNYAGIPIPSFPVPTPGLENPLPIGR
jgi:hypothetical protein